MKKCLIIIFLLCMSGCASSHSQQTPTPDAPVSTPPLPPVSPTPVALVLDHESFTSIHVIINKQHALSQDFEPDDLVSPSVSVTQEGLQLRKEASRALEIMFEHAKQEGVLLRLGSAYRSYKTQKNLYNSYVQRDGEALANRYSAKPGESEHQTGLAVDISDDRMSAWLATRFEDTLEGQWLAENSYRFGFILRYPRDKEEITGYMYEPWHFRYVGLEEALKIFESSLTLEDYES